MRDNHAGPPVTYAVVAQAPTVAVQEALLPPPARQPRVLRRLVLIVLAFVVFVTALLLDPDFGMFGLIPFGLLLAFSTDSDEPGSRRSVILTWRNLGLAAAMVTAFTWFWLLPGDLSDSMHVVVAGALIALPLALQESAADRARERTIAVTKRSLILALWGLVTFAYVYQDRGVWFFGLAAVCVVVPLALVASRVWRRGRIELGLLRHPLRRELRAHLLQGLNIWLCCGLLGGVLAAGGAHYARIRFSLNAAQFNVVVTAFVAGLVLLAALAVLPRRRIYLATNVVVALLSGFLAFQLVHISIPRADAIVLDAPLAGEWFVLNGGRSALLNGHSPNESNAVDFQRMGTNGRTHIGGGGAPLTDYAGFGLPVLAPADGRIVEVTDGYADTPPGTNGDHANNLVLDIGGSRYVVLAHLKQGSVTVQAGEVVRRGQPLAAVGNTGHTNEPHLHLQVQDSPTGKENADRTYPMVLRNVHITRGGAWPLGDARELRTGDLVRAIRQ
jgi:murein DD-endopeptidase MepM/ murein hydrolase activator NlpD